MTCLKLQLKPLSSNQLEQAVALDQLCFGGLWTLEGYQREIANPNSTLLILTIPNAESFDQEQIIGLGCYWAILEEAHITMLAVHPDFQGQGLGKLLIYHLLESAYQRQLERATLEVKATNEVALGLYTKFGFKIAGRRKGYYQDTGEDALILWRNDLAKPEFPEKLAQWQREFDHICFQ